MSQTGWAPLTEADLPALRELARACLRADGGLPHLAEEPMLRRHYLSGVGLGGRDETGDLVAAAGVLVDRAGRHTVTGLVRPSARGAGLGDELAAWCREQSGGALLRVVVESVSPGTEEFLGRLGLRRTFAEHVMRHDLVDVPRIKRPAGLRSLPWDEQSAPLFHAAYSAAFAERPGFPGTPLEEWLHDVADEEGFRPDRSRVAVDADGRPAGFVTLTDDWVDQVGVVPAWRGRGLGAHLVARSLRSLRKAGCEQAWLAVNVDNPAHTLYLRLGFTDAGLRARYEQVA